MILDKLFPSQKDKNEAIEKLSALKDDPNWQFMRDYIVKSDIDELTETILGTYFEDLKVERFLKAKRDLMIILSQLPDKIVEALEKGEDAIPDFDPYPKTIEDLKREKSE